MSTVFFLKQQGNYTFIMDDTEACRNTVPFLVLMVPVRPNDLVGRDAIRRTWGNGTLIHGRLVRTLFLVGRPGEEETERQQELLRLESSFYRDLVQSSFLDSYRNLTIKTMVMLEWLAWRCPNASYVMKIDSDVFLNVPNLVRLLSDPATPRQNYMTGLVWWHSPVLRSPRNKFFLPEAVIAESEYPPYPLGMAYAMSLDLPKKILSVSSQIKPIIEDAYLGMCLKRLSSPTDPPDRGMFRVNPFFALSRCSLSKVIAVTTTGTRQLMTYWKEHNKPPPPC
ncbi:LOW QUALITY PROTEIN: beta-1,3-galactosyltransferase 2-like [Aplochiton taeniatus]